MPIRQQLLNTYRWLFARRVLAPAHRAVLRLSLKALGVNNYETFALSGESFLLQRVIAPLVPLRVLDVGANVGNYARMLRQAAPHAEVYAFEPHPRTFETLDRHATQYGFTAIHAGCGATAGTALLYDYAHAHAGSSHASMHRAVFDSQTPVQAWEVPITTLDDFALAHQLDRIDLLKIDTEGNELAVLRGASRLLREERIGMIQFEFDRMHVMSHTLMYDFYTTLAGYRFYRLLPNDLLPLGSYDALLWEQFAYQNIVAVQPKLHRSNRYFR